MAITRPADIAEYIADRCNVYDAALEADLRRLRAVHGSDPVLSALKLLGRDNTASQWDAPGHAKAVQHGLQRVLVEQSLKRQRYYPDD